MNEINLNDRITKSQKAARKFDEGDHWQNGEAFLPFLSLDIKNRDEQRAQMKASFESENKIAEVLDNEQNAVFGRKPDWQVVPPTENTQNTADEAAKALQSYWDDYDLPGILKEANRLAATQSRAIIRAYIPKGLLADGIDKRDLRSAMDLIRFEVLDAEKAGVFLDNETYTKFGVHKKQTKDGRNLTELTCIEDKKTVIKITTESNFAALASATLASLRDYMPPDGQMSEETSYDLGGEILYFEIKRSPYITDSIMTNQMDVNLCLTTKNRITYKHAYPDLFIFNAKQPVDKDGNPAPIKTGGKAANFLAGDDVFDKDGNTTNYATPSMTVLNPTSAEHAILSLESSAKAIYNQTSQIHLAKDISENVSGRSKRESRFSFEKHSDGVGLIINPAGRWMLKVLTLFGADIINQSEIYKEMRFDFNCRIDPGEPDAEEIAQAAADVENGLLSEETYLSKYLRFDDADAEKQRIKESESYQIATWDKRIATAKEMRDLGLPESEWVAVLYPNDEGKQKEIIEKIKPVEVANANTATV